MEEEVANESNSAAQFSLPMIYTRCLTVDFFDLISSSTSDN